MKRFVYLSALLSFLLVFGACGGGGSDPEDYFEDPVVDPGTDPGTDPGGDPVNNVVGSINITGYFNNQLVAFGSDPSNNNSRSYGLIRATAKNTDNQPLANQTITFNAPSGSFSPQPSAVTNASGVAQINLVAPKSLGSDKIIASAGGVISNELTVTYVNGPAANMIINASPSTVGPGGTSTISAYLLDANKFPVPGEYCTFSISDRKSGPEAFVDPIMPQTDASGKATTVYTAGSGAGTDVVTATAGAATKNQNMIVTQSATYLKDLTLTIANKSLVADGVDYTIISVLALDNDSKPQQGVSITFTTTLGGVKAVGTTGAGTSSLSVSTDSTGYARAILISSTATGEGDIKVSAGGISKTDMVSFIPGPPSSVVLTVYPATVAPTGAATLTATVKDKDSHPVVGKKVAFEFVSKASGNPVLSAVEATTNAVGEAQVTYTAGIQAGTDKIKARALTNNKFSSELSIVISAAASTGVVNSIDLTAGSSSIVANGTSGATIRAVVKDTDGKPAAGFQVDFTTTAGTLTGGDVTGTPSSDTTDSNGVAEVSLKSASALGTALVIGTVRGFSDSTSVAFVPGPIASVSLNASPSDVGAGGQSTITANIKDSKGNPVADETVQFYFALPADNVSGGVLTNSIGTTDTNGRFSIVYTAGQTSGSDKLSAKTTNGTSGFSIIKVGSAVSNIASLDLIAASPSITANASSKSLIQATVTGTDRKPKSGVTVEFVKTQGTLSATSASTDTNGVASVNLTSASKPGIATVTASTGGFSKEVQVAFVPGGPDASKSSITASPSTLPPDGSSTTEVTVVLLDAGGNLVANGTPVTLFSTKGTITSANPSTTTSGRATFTLKAPTSQGTATLSVAEVGSLSGAVTFGTSSTGAPANIILTVANSSIFVAGVGQKENTTISIQIQEANGTPIDETLFKDDNGDAVNTALVSFITSPGGGEYISGMNAAGETVTTLTGGHIDVVTTGGSASLNLQAGTLPGPVEIRVEALGTDGLPLDPAVVASLPQVTIASGPPHTIQLSHPITDSIVNLNDEGSLPAGWARVPGFYRRVGGASVTDRYGNDVPDGTIINLGLVDSVITMGKTGQTTSAGTTLTDSNGNFLAGYINRNNAARFIQDNDRILVLNAQSGDKSRFVSDATSRTATTVKANSAYGNAATGLHYIIGGSLFGAYISGEDENGTLVKGTAKVKDGTAKFWVTYPANVDTILNGCYGYSAADPGSYFAGDVRFGQSKSAQVYVVAATSNNGAATVDQAQFCYAGIAGFSLAAAPAKLTGSGSVTLDLKDGGDGVPLPFVPVSYSITYDTLGTYDVCSDDRFPDKTTCEAAATCSNPAYATLASCLQNGGTWSPTWLTDIPSDLAISVDMTYTGGIPGNAGRTDINATFDAPVTVTGGLSGDKATITFRSGDGSASVAVEIP